jgi:protein-tyrosine phosphatase
MKKNCVSVMFVCLGNICRSPAGEGVLKHFLEEKSDLDIYIESCGMGDWHVGQPPDKRMQEAALARGIHLTSRAQKFSEEMFDRFDYIFVADKEVLKNLCHYAKKTEHKEKISLMTLYSSTYQGQEVPDPYYLSNGAFELVLDMLEDSCRGFLEHIQKKTK